jgi:hypothetical protein
MAAFYARTTAKLSRNDGAGTVVSSKAAGEYVMPDASDPAKKGREMNPVFLDGVTLDGSATDLERREQLARFVTSPENAWFAKAYVNRVWARLTGRGFYEPVDNIGESQPQHLPELHETLAAHFLATNYDTKDLLRLIMATRIYQQVLASPAAPADHPEIAQRLDGSKEQTTPGPATRSEPGDPAAQPIAGAVTIRLRGDEVFSALATGIALPNITPPAVKPTAAVRFPPPPKSTRDLVADAFGFDPSLAPTDIPRTMNQAMLMMNNEQLQAQISAAPESNTLLSKLLAETADDSAAIERLFRAVLARKPSGNEAKLARDHIAAASDRGAGFEDLLWSLINSAEFTSKR